jgi:hypothetical protein
VETTLTVRNLSRRRLVFIGSVYNVQARNVTSRLPAGDRDWQAQEELARDGWSGRFEQARSDQLIEAGCALYNLGDFLEPGQHDVTTLVSLVPERLFNTVSVQASVLTVRGDRLRMGEVRGRTNQEDRNGSDTRPAVCTGDAPTEWRIETPTWAERITRNTRYLHVEYDLWQGPRRRELIWTAYADAEPNRLEPYDSYNDRIADDYGMGWVGIYRELALETR